MATATLPDSRTKSFSDPAFKKRLQELRQTDNWRNWFYLVRTYALLAAVIGGAIWFYHWTRAGGASLLWNVPVFAVAIVMVGALQHHLANLAHEAVHHTLFKNRYLNDLVSEWLCSFPMFSSTFHYGLHHLAHHQFVNDPVRDPDISQMQKSGHRLSFPISATNSSTCCSGRCGCRTSSATAWPGPSTIRSARHTIRTFARTGSTPSCRSD